MLSPIEHLVSLSEAAFHHVVIRDVTTGFFGKPFSVVENGLKPDFGSTGLHRSLNFKPS